MAWFNWSGTKKVLATPEPPVETQPSAVIPGLNPLMATPGVTVVRCRACSGTGEAEQAPWNADNGPRTCPQCGGAGQVVGATLTIMGSSPDLLETSK